MTRLTALTVAPAAGDGDVRGCGVSDGQDFVELAEVVRHIRGELEKARDDAEGRPLGFTVERVNLEFSVQVHRSASGRGGLRIGVVTAELGGQVDRQTTHQVQVELVPEYEGGRLRVARGTPPRPSGS
ncbi:trypco2 family protein [Streptomyces kanasensis]|uniref:trypco2 family protein n=1 Tax=Streptomyces kanasensis TaxID=936756 RepID=UPI0036F58876